MSLSPRERVVRALCGRDVDKTPFTAYENKILDPERGRELKRMGLCVIDRRVPVFRAFSPNVKFKESRYVEGGRCLIRHDYETPKGTLTAIYEDRGYTRWCLRHLFSGPEDYDRLIFLYEDQRYEPNFEEFARAQEEAGPDVLLRPGIGYEPLQQVIHLMGTERFCFEWMERRDEVLRLYEAIVEARRRLYPLLAESPALLFNYGGNVMPEVIGPKVFEKFYLPHYNEAAEILHKRGKLVGTHLDGNCRLIADLVAKSELDYVEAFTPAPDTDMTLEEAVRVWRHKALWINFPSSLHLANEERIYEATLDLLRQAEGHPRFIIGITETVPQDRWFGNFKAILRAIDDYHRGR